VTAWSLWLASSLLLVAFVAGIGGGPVVRGADPSPGPGVTDPIDPRSDGEGPGVQGTPLEILAAVVLLGMAAAGVTVLWARLTRED
jgi:hypothetical protein